MRLRFSSGLLAAALLVFDAAAATLQPDQSASVVAQLVARIFEQTHYNRRPVDDAVSRQFLQNYIDFLDYNHMILEKSDVDRFQAMYNDTLDDRIKEGDLTPAYEIFDRFLQRLEERAAMVKTLTASTFTFTTNETLLVDRREAPWPATPREALELWRLRIKYEILQEKLENAKPEDQVKTINTRYERLLRTFKEYDASDVLQTYLTALAHSYDPHSDYMAAPQAENFNISMKLSLVGIGAVLRSEDGFAKIVSLLPGGPADADKRLKPNDKIEAVAQGDEPFLEVVGMKLDRLVQLIRGEKGSVVRLRVIPADALDPGTRVVISLVRDEIRLTDQEARAKIITVPGSPAGKSARVGVIDLPSFYADMKSAGQAKSTTRDVGKILAYLKQEGIDALILDLRRNGGGSLAEAVTLTGLFIPEGPVVQIKDTRGLIKNLKDTDPEMAYAGPMLVLTSRASASASEIFAGAMQDYGRAVIVGEKSTFGKGTVQSVVELSQYLPAALQSYKPGSLKLTIQKFYRVSGGSTQNRGVIPDIRLPSLADQMDGTETSLKNALPYDEVEPARYQKLDLVAPALGELQKTSLQRVNSSPEFAWVREDVERFKRQQQDKMISLNESARREEKKFDEERLTQRKKDRSARKNISFEAREITLDSIDGKPPPAKPKAKMAKKEDAETEDEGYAKAPPAPDLFLDESLRIVADLANLTTLRQSAAASSKMITVP